MFCVASALINGAWSKGKIIRSNGVTSMEGVSGKIEINGLVI